MGRTGIPFDCGPFGGPDAVMVERLARLQLLLRRSGCELHLTDAGSSLTALIGFSGLSGVLGVEPSGKAEEREEPGGVEKEGQLGDPAV